MNNESWDLLTYAIACAYHLGIHRMTDNYIEKRRKKLQLDVKKNHIEEIEEAIEVPIEEVPEELIIQSTKKPKIKRKQGTSFSRLW